VIENKELLVSRTSLH